MKDGLSHTYMLGEKHVDCSMARKGTSWGDDQGPFVSDDRDIVRWASSAEISASDPGSYFRPHYDSAGNPVDAADINYGLWGNGTYNFGSAHATGFNAALCDGSVQHVSYEISEEVHRRYCNRLDGMPGGLPPE